MSKPDVISHSSVELEKTQIELLLNLEKKLSICNRRK